MLHNVNPEVMFKLIASNDFENMLVFLTVQMSAKASLKEFGKGRLNAIMKELEQLLYWKVMARKHQNELTKEQKKSAPLHFDDRNNKTQRAEEVGTLQRT